MRSFDIRRIKLSHKLFSSLINSLIYSLIEKYSNTGYSYLIHICSAHQPADPALHLYCRYDGALLHATDKNLFISRAALSLKNHSCLSRENEPRLIFSDTLCKYTEGPSTHAGQKREIEMSHDIWLNRLMMI